MRGWLAVLLIAWSDPARATWCNVDAWTNGSVPAGDVFPNWVQVWAGSYDVLMCDPLSCPGATPEILRGITVANFGTAGTADISAVYWRARCGATTTGMMTMTYAGLYVEDIATYPAWTWAGSSIDLSACPDLCSPTPCGGWYTIDLYADVAPCPSDGDTIQLGFPTHWFTDTITGGSLTDNNGCSVPWGDLFGNPKTIHYVLKTTDAGQNVAPGDTVTYTVTYGRPGTTALSSIAVMDTQPVYTHYLPGGTPAPDAGWDPDYGPPVRLRWSGLPGGAVTGGPTSQLTFKVTVDWGNEPWDPGSGNVAAPEGTRLDNQAQVFWSGVTGCAGSAVNLPVSTVVKRFLFWMIPDQDILMASALGQPPDEVIYETFVRNVSNTRTWWNIKMWDTVPPELDVWCAGCGFEDPCPGPWTISPTGCAANSPGVNLSATKTMLTWSLGSLAPGVTLSLRWKAQLKPISGAGSTAVNLFSLKANGFSGIGGSGDSGPPRTFASLTKVYLRTTYISYVGIAAEENEGAPTSCTGHFLAFFPLNKQTQFELRGLEYQGAGFASVGGVSASIGCMIGDCLNGFPGNGGACPTGPISGGGNPGCRPERIPARYFPAAYTGGVCPVFPFNFIYKVTGNAPEAWQFLTIQGSGSSQGDGATFAPSASLTFTGMIHYFWRRVDDANTPGDNFSLINTGADPFGTYDPTLATTVLMFTFDFTSNSWVYNKSWDVGPESQAYDLAVGPTIPWRTISSNTQIILHNDWMGNVFGSGQYTYFWPTRETGNLVAPGPAAFYGIAHGESESMKVKITNTGPADALYEVWRYVPNTPSGTAPNPPTNLGGTIGTWTKTQVATVPAGFAAAGNPRLYNCYSPAFDAAGKSGGFVGNLCLFKVNVLSGGPVQVQGGAWEDTAYGGSAIFNAADGNPMGSQFWYSQVDGNASVAWACSKLMGVGTATDIYGYDVFCPKTGMPVRARSTSGYSATYTTLGPDQCVAFTQISDVATTCVAVNFNFDVLNGSKAMAMYHKCSYMPRGYTAPFLVTGTFYRILAPATVFQGQSFWLTVVVVDPSGTTKDDYCGTTSFTSTDPLAKVGVSGMDAYNYTWTSNVGPCGGGTDNGVKMFVNVTLSTLGMQTIVVTDTVDGSITGLAPVLVIATNVKFSKQPLLQVSASGDTVQFRMCWSNYSTGSAFTFVITDAVPVGAAFVPETGTAGLVCSAPPGASVVVAYSTSTTSTPPATWTTANPVAGTRWLKWTVSAINVNTTGCACFRVSVN